MSKAGRKTVVYLPLLLLVALGIVAACGLVKDNYGPTSDCSTSTSTGSNPSADAFFQTNVYPILGSNCRLCHNGPNPIGPNRVGDTDESISLQNALPRLLDSRLYNRGSDGHCQGCSVANDPAAKANFKTQLEGWLALVNGQTGNCPTTAVPAADMLSTAETIPPGLSTTTFSRVRIPLDSLGQAGAIIDVGVRSLATGFYEFGDFRMYTPSSQLDFTGFKAWVVNGSQSQGNTTLALFKFTNPQTVGVDLTVTPLNTTPFTSQSIIGQAIGANDQVAVSFQKLTPISDCHDLNSFTTNIIPVINYGLNGSGACISCHGDPNDSSYAKFPISLYNTRQLCLDFRWRLGAGMGDGSSLLLRKLLGAQPPHPVVFPTSALDPIRTWRAAEFQ